MSNKSFVRGAAILAAAGIFAKFLGIFFKLPLVYLLGDHGVGLYQYPYPIYNAMLAISIIGVPAAISKLVSSKVALKKYEDAQVIFRVAVQLLALIGLVSSAILLFGSGFIVRMAGWDPDTRYSLYGLALAPLFVSIMAAFRGYFQGLQFMIPTALSQIIESLGRVVFGIGLAAILTEVYGVGMGAGGASFGATAGAFCGVIVLLIFYYAKRGEIKKRIGQGLRSDKNISRLKIAGEIFNIAIPISIGAAVSSVMSLIDSFIVPRRLAQIGIESDLATELFGRLGAKAFTLINVPLTISVALSASLVPSISEALARNDHTALRERAAQGTRVVWMLAIPAATGLSILGTPIISLLFPSQPEGGEILSILAVSLPFIMLTQTFTSVLQGLGRLYVPVRNLVYGAIVKVIVNYFLVASELNIKGAAIGTIAGYLVASVLNYRSIKKYTKMRLDVVNILVKPVISSVVMGLAAYWLYHGIDNELTSYLDAIWANRVATLVSITIGVVIYGIIMLASGGLRLSDLKLIPGGDRAAAFLERLGFFKN